MGCGKNCLLKTPYERFFMQKIFTLCCITFGAMLMTVNSCFAETPTQEEIQNLEKLCRENNVNACAGLGFLYAEGEEGIKQDYFKAKKYWSKVCSLNDGGGCSILGGLYYEGMGVKQSYIKAKEYIEKSCDLNYAAGCWFLGLLYDNGRGVKQDYFKAKEYYEKSCNLNDGGQGCGLVL
jgi:TPR repeat protein